VIENGSFESFGAVSYSPSIYLAILEIFSDKEWPDLDIWVWVVDLI